MLRHLLLIGLLLLAPLAARADDAQNIAEENARLRAGQALLSTTHAHAVGDLPAMRQRGVIRVLVDWNRTSFFIENG